MNWKENEIGHRKPARVIAMNFHWVRVLLESAEDQAHSSPKQASEHTKPSICSERGVAPLKAIRRLSRVRGPQVKYPSISETNLS